VKRTEFFKKIGLGIGSLVVAPKILVPKDEGTEFVTLKDSPSHPGVDFSVIDNSSNLSVSSTNDYTVRGYDLSLPNTIDGYKPAFTPKRADFKRFKYESPWEKSI